MQTTAQVSHIADPTGRVIAIEDLSAEDLAHLLSVAREREARGGREEDVVELRRALWRLLRAMPRDTAREIAAAIGTEHPGVVAATYQQAFLDAAFGPGPIPTIGAVRRSPAVAI